MVELQKISTRIPTYTQLAEQHNLRALRFRLPETAANASKTNAVVASTTNQSGGPQRTGERGGNRGERGGSGSAGKSRGERSPVRTIYALGEDGKPKPVQVKLGISDGIMTEVTDGLKEGDKIITGTVQAKNDSGGNTTPSNPFGGGGFPRR